ncbi:MAG: phosphatidylglycerophosphatase A [Gammaproteobacteria bacterium]|nr:phosphatidylglycerophosphatase A [Gammaproteobacteria bacterium]
MKKIKRNHAPRSIWTNPVHFLAFGLGTGASPYAPGTVGTLLGIPLVYLLSDSPLWVYLMVCCVLILVGTWICDKTSRDIGVHDHSGIVIDEVAGYLVTMIAIPVNIWTLLAAFIAFRVFDIIKPWPIDWLDKKVRGGLGIMVDDLLAGIYGLAVMWLILWVFPSIA